MFNILLPRKRFCFSCCFRSPLSLFFLGIYLFANTGCFFSKGPTQKSSKYGIGPSQQDKIAKYTGPTQSYQMSELLTNNFCCQKNYCFVELQSFQSYTHFITMVRVWTVRQRTFLVERKLQGADLAQITAEYAQR